MEFPLTIGVLVLFSVALVYTSPFQKCTTGNPIISLDASDCGAETCNFVIGSVFSANATFKAVENAGVLWADVLANTSDTYTEYPLHNHDACQTLVQGKCPIDGGETVIYHLSLDVIDVFPPGSEMTLQVALIDEHANITACFHVNGVVSA